MEAAVNPEAKNLWLNRPVTSLFPGVTVEHLLVTLIIIATVISRFYAVGLRVMSHDEVNHVVPSYELYQGRGYAHDPVTHGPLQFHLLAASYFLMGDSDFASRVPAALFSIATVVFVLFAFRRYLGRTGALLAGLFFLVSPYMLFYGRYTRNEAFVALFGVVMLYSVLRYLETGRHNILYLFTVVLALHFVTKETAFIYTAQLLIFLAVLFLRDVIRKEWKKPTQRDAFVFAMMGVLLFLAVALGAAIMYSGHSAAEQPTPQEQTYHILMLASLGMAFAALVVAAVVLIRSLKWAAVKDMRSFDLLILTISMILPQLIAFPMNLAKLNPLDYSETGLVTTSLFLLGAVILSLILGLLWKPRLWAVNIGIFYAIFTIFYTTFFTNGQGFFTGLVGSLGYWLTQQGVNRGSQPWYFFAFLQVPMYEFLPLVGTLLALFIGLKHKLFSTLPGIAPFDQAKSEDLGSKPFMVPEHAAVEDASYQLTWAETEDGSGEGQTTLPLETGAAEDEAETSTAFPESTVVVQNADAKSEIPQKLPVLALLLFWSVMSLLAYTLAGEKMPWLTVHITLPMILCAGFGFGYLVDSTPFRQMAGKKAGLILLTLPVFLVALGAVLSALIGSDRPFAGKELDQLRTTSTFLFSCIALVVAGWLLIKWLDKWRAGQIAKLILLALGAVLLVFTARSAFQANYINYDTAKEFLVYAHSARGPKDVLEQVEEISLRTTGGKDIKVAYIGDALYPYWWYFRDYPNKVWLQDDLTRDLLNYPIVIADDERYTKTQAILKDGYFETKYTRLVWPMQDYFGLTWERIWKGFINPEMRQAILDIWLHKDYTLYSKVSGNNNLRLETWQPSANIYLFIKKDIVSQIWTYGALPVQTEVVETDPYESNHIELTPDKIFGSTGNLGGQLSAVRGIAVAGDGSIYVADSQNHRIQKFSSEGEYLMGWGSYATVDSGNAPGGTFNEPWGIAVGADGRVYVADTWNHRIQVFSADGKFITMWGVPGLAEQPDQFWGPRGIAVDKSGLVYVTDTGNNRVAVFSSTGEFKTQFGTNGINPGEFDEPVGIAVDGNGLIYVVDTWNQRVQVFERSDNGFTVMKEWPVAAWFGQSINNKPFIALDAEGHVFVTDPDGFRVLEFDQSGNYMRGWGAPSSGIDGFGLPTGIAVDAIGRVWVSDAENNYVLRFNLPAVVTQAEPVEPEIPELPAGVTYDAESGLVFNDMDMPVYRLSADGKEWEPIVPDSIAELLPLGIQPQKDEQDNWVLLQEDGTPAFIWDPVTFTWISTATTP